MNTFTQYSSANNAALEVLTGLQGDRNVAEVHIAKQELQEICREHREQLSPLFDTYLEAMLIFRQDKLQQALDLYETLLREIRRPEERILYPYVCIYIGTIYNYQGQALLSQYYFSLAEEKLETKDDKLLLFLNVNLSGSLLLSQEWEKALAYSERALDIGETGDNHTVYVMALMNHALALTKLARFDEAKHYLDSSVEFCTRHSLQDSFAYYQLYLSIWFQEQGNAAKANHEYIKAFGLIKATDDTLLKIEFFEAYTEFLFEQRQYRSVVKFSSQLLATSMFNQVTEGKVKIYRLLADSYQKLGDSQNENRYLREVQKLQQIEIEKQKRFETNYVKKVSQFSQQQNQSQQSVMIQDRLDLLGELGQLITSTTVAEEELLAIYKQLKKLVPTTSYSLAYYDAERHELEYRFLLEEGVFHEPFTVSCDGVSRLGIYCVKHRETVRLNNASPEEINRYIDPEFQQQNVWSVVDEGKDDHALSVIYTPVIYQDELLAVLSVQFNRTNEYTQAHERIVEQIANYLAVAMSHNRQKQELANHNDYLEQIYHTDHLTGLKNRHGFDQWIKQEYKQSTRPTSAFIIALDGLKRFNTVFTREVGDDALVECAKLIGEVLPNSVHQFRYHSDQFLIIGRFDDHAQATQLATSLQFNLKSYFSLTYGTEADEVVLTSTVGVTNLTDVTDRQECERRLTKLEATIYDVKRSKRDGVFELKADQNTLS